MKSVGIDRSQHNFDFTRRWFLNRNASTFCKYILPKWKDKKLIYLELGVFEGMSMVWMMQNILTHPESYAVGIDPWLITRKLLGNVMEQVMERAFHNTKCFPNCKLIRGSSVEVLNRMRGKKGFEGIKKNTVDLCMIDGDHNSLGVLSDCYACYNLIKTGGWMLFDDVENRIEKKDHVKQGLSRFLEEYEGKVKMIWKHNFMECYEKL